MRLPIFLNSEDNKGVSHDYRVTFNQTVTLISF